MSKFTSNPTLNAARQWLQRGYLVIPVPPRKKAPDIDGWQLLRLTAEELPRYFNDEQGNIGVLLGEPRGEADIDLDCLEALAAWPEFAPPTGLIFGRASKLASHYFYLANSPLKTTRFIDPINKKTILELRCLTADGKAGLQTLVPPSIHPGGEEIRFDRDGEPAIVPADALLRAAQCTSAAVLLARYFPGEGSRHIAFLALAGVLARALWKLADAVKLHRAIYRCLWPADADFRAAESEVDSTYQRLDDGREISGFPTLSQLVNPKALAACMRWLGLTYATGARRSVQMDPEVLESSPLNKLNAASIFEGRIKLASARRRGQMIIVTTTDGAEIVWDSVRDLMSFHVSQANIAEATDVVLIAPPKNQMKAVWDSVAELVLQAAAEDKMLAESGLVEEFRGLIRLVWQHAGVPKAELPEDMVAVLRLCSTYVRPVDPSKPPECCVWLRVVEREERACCVHLPSLQRWLSVSAEIRRYYPPADIQRALMELGFRYSKDLHRRSAKGKDGKASIWIGPPGLLEGEE